MSIRSQRRLGSARGAAVVALLISAGSSWLQPPAHAAGATAATCSSWAARLAAGLAELDPSQLDKRMRELEELKKVCSKELEALSEVKKAIELGIVVTTCNYKLQHLEEYYDAQRTASEHKITIVRARFGETEQENWESNRHTCNATTFFAQGCKPDEASCVRDRGDLGKPANSDDAAAARRSGIDVCGYDVSEAARAFSLTADARKNRIEVQFRCQGEQAVRTILVPGATKIVHMICPPPATAPLLSKTFFENKHCPVLLDMK